jgi:hypothetical protein
MRAPALHMQTRCTRTYTRAGVKELKAFLAHCGASVQGVTEKPELVALAQVCAGLCVRACVCVCA